MPWPMPRPVPISQSGCCDSFLIIFRIEVCPVLRLLFSERRSAQVLSDSDLVPDKTFKRYKVAKFHRSVPFKTFSRNDCGKISPAIPILRTPFHSADGQHRHRSLAVLSFFCHAVIIDFKYYPVYSSSGIEVLLSYIRINVTLRPSSAIWTASSRRRASECTESLA